MEGAGFRNPTRLGGCNCRKDVARPGHRISHYIEPAHGSTLAHLLAESETQRAENAALLGVPRTCTFCDALFTLATSCPTYLAATHKSSL